MGAAAAALVVDAGAAVGEAVGEAVGDALEDEELLPVAPGGTDSSGNFYSCQLDSSFTDVKTDCTWPGCNMKDDFSAPSRWTSKLVVALGLITPTMP